MKITVESTAQIVEIVPPGEAQGAVPGREPNWRGLGQRVRAARERQGLGLREAARRLQVSAPYLSDLERGARSWQGPKARALLQLVKVRA